jgi:fucose 4-O-acetylase-like acetyltransferase
MLEAELTENDPSKKRIPRSNEFVVSNGAESMAAVKDGERDLLFDAMKGFGILLVIMGHALQQSSPQYADNFAFGLIYSFHMPLFFFVSGYIFQAGLERKKLLAFPFLQKKARALVVPFLSWYLIFGLWRGLPPGMTLAEYVQRFVETPAYGYWFLWVLFLCFVLFLPLAWMQQRVNAKWQLGLLIISYLCARLIRGLPTNDYGLVLLKIHYFYFAVGFFICCWRKPLAIFKSWWPEICLVGFLLMIPHYRSGGELPLHRWLVAHHRHRAAMFTDVFIYSLALFGIGSVATIVKSLMPGTVGRSLAWIGRYTLDIYVIHLYTLSLYPFGLIFSNRSDTFIILLKVAWGLGASLAISFLILRRSVVLKFLFLGILDSRKPVFRAERPLLPEAPGGVAI